MHADLGFRFANGANCALTLGFRADDLRFYFGVVLASESCALLNRIPFTEQQINDPPGIFDRDIDAGHFQPAVCTRQISW